MKLRSLAILLLLLLSLIPAYYITQRLREFLQPRRSLGRLFLFLLTSLALVLIYTLLLVWLIVKLFPLH
jgi:hypothetical protein